MGQAGGLIERHLAAWLGAWPPRAGIAVVGCPQRVAPAWDGRIHPVVGVLTPAGGVLSVPPPAADAARELVAAGPGAAWSAELLGALPRLVGAAGRPALETALRYTTAPAPLPDAGVWLRASDPAVPGWLKPFGGCVLVALDSAGRYRAGLGLKRHDAFGRELAVGTEPEARNAGLGRRLVAQAARAVLAAGRVPTYRHLLDNPASARVATAAGFPDLGWRFLTLADEQGEP